MYIYSVYFYNTTQIPSVVYPIGFYDNLDDAKNRLNEIMNGYKPWTKNTVIKQHLIGWINKNAFGNFVTNMSSAQPHSAINLFE